MDIFKTLLAEKSGTLVNELTAKAGFSTEQAEKFVPEAGTAVVDSLKSQAGSLSETDLAGPEGMKAVLGGIDIEALSGKAGIPSALGAQGLTSMLPTLMGMLSSKAGGLGGLLGMMGGAEGGAAATLGKLAGGAGASAAKLGGNLFGK